jgi:hypothetical protein
LKPTGPPLGKDHEVLGKDRVARKAWDGEYPDGGRKPPKKRGTLRGDLVFPAAEMLTEGQRIRIGSKALKRSKTPERLVGAERIHDRQG